MAKMVTAYDTRTGEALPNPVPQSWLDRGIFAHLSATPPAPAAQPVSVPVDEPNDTWTVHQLRAHADRREIGRAHV